jgi:hypothetical protein
MLAEVINRVVRSRKFEAFVFFIHYAQCHIHTIGSLTFNTFLVKQFRPVRAKEKNSAGSSIVYLLKTVM